MPDQSPLARLEALAYRKDHRDALRAVAGAKFRQNAHQEVELPCREDRSELPADGKHTILVVSSESGNGSA